MTRNNSLDHTPADDIPRMMGAGDGPRCWTTQNYVEVTLSVFMAPWPCCASVVDYGRVVLRRLSRSVPSACCALGTRFPLGPEGPPRVQNLRMKYNAEYIIQNVGAIRLFYPLVAHAPDRLGMWCSVQLKPPSYSPDSSDLPIIGIILLCPLLLCVYQVSS